MTIPAVQRRTSAKAKAREESATCVVGYLRVSTRDQADSGLGIEAQRAAIQARCQAEGWTVEWCEDAGVSGSVDPAKRPGMARALRLLETGQAGALVVAKLDRCSRSLHDVTGLVLRADAHGWRFVALDIGVDTGTPVGRLLVGMLGGVAEFERERIRERTRDALAIRKANGVRLGRPVSVESAAARARLRELLEEGGRTHQQLATALNDEGYTTATGLQWTRHHVQRTRDSLALDDLAASAR